MAVFKIYYIEISQFACISQLLLQYGTLLSETNISYSHGLKYVIITLEIPNFQTTFDVLLQFSKTFHNGCKKLLSMSTEKKRIYA